MAPLAVDPEVLDGAGAAVISAGEGLGSVITGLQSDDCGNDTLPDWPRGFQRAYLDGRDVRFRSRSHRLQSGQPSQFNPKDCLFPRKAPGLQSGSQPDSSPARSGCCPRVGPRFEGVWPKKIPAFPCHFTPLGLERRHVRSPRTPGGLLRRQPGRVAAFNFLQNKDLTKWRPSPN